MIHHTNTGNPICVLQKAVSDLLERVVSLEHYSNQQSILVDTLMTIIMGTYGSSKRSDMPKYPIEEHDENT